MDVAQDKAAVAALGAAIREARQRAGLTQRELGKRLGVAHARVAEWELGHKQPLGLTLLEIAEELGVTADSFRQPTPAS